MNKVLKMKVQNRIATNHNRNLLTCTLFSMVLLLLVCVNAQDDTPVSDTSSSSFSPDSSSENDSQQIPIQLPAQSDPALPEYLGWLTSHGVDHSKVRIVDINIKGRGLVSNELIKANTIMFSIPMDIIITQKSILTSPFAEKLKDKHPTDHFALFIAYSAINPTSSYYPYISSFPPFLPTPLFYSPELLNETNKTILRSYADLRRSIAINVYRHFSPSLREEINQQRYMWSLSMGWSRLVSIYTQESDEDGDLAWTTVNALVPLADMINTDEPDKINTKCTTNKKATHFICKSTVDIPPNMEILVSYGNRSSAQLLMDYGFLLPNNPNDRVHIKLPSLKEKQPNDTESVLMRRKDVEEGWRDYLITNNLPINNNIINIVDNQKNEQFNGEYDLLYPSTVDFANVQELSEIIKPLELLGYLRLMHIDKYDNKQLVPVDMINFLINGTRFSYQNDFRVIKSFIPILRKHLKEMPGTLQADVERLNSTEVHGNIALYYVILERYAEKSVLYDLSEILARMIDRWEDKAKEEFNNYRLKEEEEKKKQQELANKKKKEKKEKEAKRKKEDEEQQKLEEEAKAREKDRKKNYEINKKKREEELKTNPDAANKLSFEPADISEEELEELREKAEERQRQRSRNKFTPHSYPPRKEEL